MEFDSWRHQTHQPPSAAFNHMSSTMDPYMSSFYGSQYFPGYGVGDGTWSNGGDPAMTFLGNYGQGMQGVGGESVPPPGAPYTVAGGVDSLGQATMFSSGGFGAFGQPAGYGFDFHGAAAGGVNGYSQWGQVPGGANGQFRGPELAAYQQTAVEERRVPQQAEQAMQGLSLQHSSPGWSNASHWAPSRNRKCVPKFDK